MFTQHEMAFARESWGTKMSLTVYHVVFHH